MNYQLIIKSTNRIVLFTTVALFYWVIIFLTITVFDLKVFREHISEIFYLSVVGIFALLGGALILNVMSNLSRISDALSAKEGEKPKSFAWSKPLIVVAGLSVPVLIVLLFVGNKISADKKEKILISAAHAMVLENQKELETVAQYEFGKQYIEQTGKILDVMSRIDKNFPEVKVVHPDLIGEKKVFLAFGRGRYDFSKDAPEKQGYIFSASKEDRAYLESTFARGSELTRFVADGGHYELYLPVKVKNRVLVLYLSDYQYYGKIGS